MFQKPQFLLKCNKCFFPLTEAHAYIQNKRQTFMYPTHCTRLSVVYYTHITEKRALSHSPTSHFLSFFALVISSVCELLPFFLSTLQLISFRDTFHCLDGSSFPFASVLRELCERRTGKESFPQKTVEDSYIEDDELLALQRKAFDTELESCTYMIQTSQRNADQNRRPMLLAITT